MKIAVRIKEWFKVDVNWRIFQAIIMMLTIILAIFGLIYGKKIVNSFEELKTRALIVEDAGGGIKFVPGNPTSTIEFYNTDE